MHPAAWHPDPTGRHQFRYWDGAAWTEHVANDGVTGTDPLSPAPPPASITPEPTPEPLTITTPAGNTPSEPLTITTPADSTINETGPEWSTSTEAPSTDDLLTTLTNEVIQLRHEMARLAEVLSDTSNKATASTNVSTGNVPIMPAVSIEPTSRNTVATTSAVIGSVSLVLAFLPVIGVLGVIAGIGAVILGVVGRSRAKETGLGSGTSLAGIITGALAAIIGVAVTVALVMTLNSSSFLEEYRQYTACVEETDDPDGCADQFENRDLFRFLG